MAKEAAGFDLNKLPRNTPSWALGLAVVLLATSAAITAVWVFAGPVIQKKVEASVVIQEKQVENDNTNFTSVLVLVRANTEQITSLSVSLLKAQDSNRDLANRVANLEKDLAVSRASLEACEAIKKGKG